MLRSNPSAVQGLAEERYCLQCRSSIIAPLENQAQNLGSLRAEPSSADRLVNHQR